MSIPMVSVVVPMYNAAPYTGAALESILGQTWPALEIIIVDDGSTDDSAAIAARYAGGRLRLVQQANAGAASARNHGMSLAQGYYIQFFDADDRMTPDKIARQVEALTATPGKVAACGWRPFIHEPGDLA